MNNKKKRVITGVVIACIIVIIALLALAEFITDILWFSDLGYISVFLTKLFTQLTIGVPVFLVLLLVGTLYLNSINKRYHKRLIVTEEKIGAKGQKRMSLGIAAISSLIITVSAVTTFWFTFLQTTNTTSFNIADPIFGLDVSFYTFSLQFVHGLNNTIIVGIVVYAFMTFIYYGIMLSACPPKAIPVEDTDEDELSRKRKSSQQRSAFTENLMRAIGIDPDSVPTQGAQPREGGGGHFRELIYVASKQIIVLGILFFLMLAVNFFLRQFDLLYTSSDVLYGAGYTDINITLWIYRIVAVLSLIAAVMFARGIVTKSVKTTITVPIIMIGVGIIGMAIGGITQTLVVSPDAINKEGRFIEYNIEFTQNAYDLRDVEIVNFPADNKLTGEDILNNADVIRNIRINDYDPAKVFYNSTQSIRQYYTFNDVDVDRYMVDGDYTQTFVTAREIDETKIPDQWLNLHLKYTHGYGVVMSRVDKVTASGQPDTLIRNIPPESQVDEIEIERSQIYFGELTSNYIVVGATDTDEFDYPMGDNNVETRYEGDSGVNLNMFNRLMFSLRENDIRLLFSSNIDSDSRIIINRKIDERVRTIMPYLQYSDPYMVTAEGKLYWIIDGYTTSKYYPYSQPYNYDYGDNTNYIRNSVKVVIDAYTGDTGFYRIDTEDPVAATLGKIFPALFREMEDLPAGVAPHIRYPSTMLNIQANIYKLYHVNNVTVFYQGEDRWDIAKEKVGASDEEVVMYPNYYMIKMPGESEVEFVNSIPYTPKDRSNMTALLVARNDGDQYGKLVLYQLPKGKIIMGPSQIDAQIAQHPQISQDFALWENSGSTYSRGNMFVIPIENSLMYVETIYLRASSASMPEVKRVIIYFNEKIAYEETLAEALDTMFGDGIGDVTGSRPIPGGIESPIEDADPTEQVEPTEPTTPEDPQAPVEPTAPVEGDPSFGAMTSEELAAAAQGAFDRGEMALRNGDWAEYGQAQEELQQILQLLLAKVQ